MNNSVETRVIDLSVEIENNLGEPIPIKIKKTGHKEGADSIGKSIIWSKKNSFIKNITGTIKYMVGIDRLDKKCFPDEEFLSLEVITINSHAGTHMDAPAHYGTICEGMPARTIEQLPIEWFYGDGVVLDLRHKKAGEFITVEDVKKSLDKIGYSLKPRDIVLLHTGTAEKWGTIQYFYDAPGMSSETTEYLINQGIKVMGIDAYGFDRPFKNMIDDYLKTKDNKYLWPAHFLGRKSEYLHMERLCNLDKIPRPFGFKVCCFPIKIKGLGASWVRAVALIDD